MNSLEDGRNAKTLRTNAGSFELLTPRDREESFEPQIVKKRQTDLHPELEAKVLSTFASGMGYRDIASHVEEIYDHTKYRQQRYQVSLTNCYLQYGLFSIILYLLSVQWELVLLPHLSVVITHLCNPSYGLENR